MTSISSSKAPRNMLDFGPVAGADRASADPILGSVLVHGRLLEPCVPNGRSAMTSSARLRPLKWEADILAVLHSERFCDAAPV